MWKTPQIWGFHNFFGKKNEISKNNLDIKELINNLGKDHNLYNFINSIQKLAIRKNLPKFDKDKIDIFLNVNDLDKFSNAKKMHKDFRVNLNFKILE